MATLSGFYPPTKQVYNVRRNPHLGCYEIYRYNKQDTLIIHRSGISTRKDANNQCVALNFRFGGVR